MTRINLCNRVTPIVNEPKEQRAPISEATFFRVMEKAEGGGTKAEVAQAALSWKPTVVNGWEARRKQEFGGKFYDSYVELKSKTGQSTEFTVCEETFTLIKTQVQEGERYFTLRSSYQQRPDYHWNSDTHSTYYFNDQQSKKEHHFGGLFSY